MKYAPLLLVLLFACSESAPPAAPPPPAPAPPAVFDITVDGEPKDLEPEELIEGRVVSIGGYRIALGPPGTYRFRTDGEELFLQADCGEWRCVGVKVGTVKRGKEYVLVDPLAVMTEGETRQLLSIEITDPVEGLESKLASIDPLRCVVWIWLSSSDDWKRFPKLPGDMRHLSIWMTHDEDSEYGHPVPDLSPLGKLEGLRWFQIRTEQSRFDLGLLAACRELETLEIPNVVLVDEKALGAFARLRTLRMRDSRVSDLSALSHHAHLEVIDANWSRVERLPTGTLAALRDLQVMGTALSAKERERFQASNPQCTLPPTWDELFSKSVEGADGFRLTEGTEEPCDTDRVALSVSDARAVKELIDGIAFDEENSGGSCFCGPGYPALELLAGDRVLLRMGVKHGYRVLSAPALERGDGHLIEPGAEHLLAWLEARGYAEARRRVESDFEGLRPIQRRWGRYEAYLPPRLQRSIRDDWDSEILRSFGREFPDERRRCEIYLRILGVDEGSWNRRYGLDRPALESWLPSVPAKVLAAVAHGSRDPDVLRGAARWFLGEGKLDEAPEAGREELIPILARHALASPRRANRQRTMSALAAMETASARKLLEEVVAGKIPPRPLPESDAEEEDYADPLWPEEEIGDVELAIRLLKGAGD